jgi:hypothetical protein
MDAEILEGDLDEKKAMREKKGSAPKVFLVVRGMVSRI